MKEIELFCKKNGFDSFEFNSVWNGKDTYILNKKEDEGLVIGMPNIAIVDTSEVNIASDEEVLSILGLSNSSTGKSGEAL